MYDPSTNRVFSCRGSIFKEFKDDLQEEEKEDNTTWWKLLEEDNGSLDIADQQTHDRSGNEVR